MIQYQQPQTKRSVWGRFVADIPTNYTVEQVNDIIEQFMQAEGFKLSKYRGETVLKKGMGVFSYPKCIKIDVRSGVVHMEAFVIMYLLRGIPLIIAGELNLDGPGGMAPIVGPKRVLREKVDRLIAALSAPAVN